MQTRYSALIILGLSLALLSACYYDKEEELYPATGTCDTTNISYAADILPVLQSNCISCHSTTLTQGNINLETYPSLSAAIASGKFSGAVNHQSGFSPMPKGGGKLSQCNLEKINHWISIGYPNN